MRHKSSLPLQLALVWSSLALWPLQHALTPPHHCLAVRPARDGGTRVTFLSEDAAGARSLYRALWSQDTRLLTCDVSTNPVVAERYSTLCHRVAARGQEATPPFVNVSALLAPDGPCAPSPGVPEFTWRIGPHGEEGKTRGRRALIFPGTLWCGTGSRAAGYQQLGMFESADRCCREHDHCLHIIPAFTMNYGVFNSNFFTVSHCDCDQRFQQCLLGVNDPVSSMVGYSFFNILRVPCFELRQQRRCTETYWWGMCKVAKEAPYAVFKSPLPYNASYVPSKYNNDTDSDKLASSDWQDVIGSPVVKVHRKPPKSARRCGPKDPPRGDTFYRPRTKAKGCKRHRRPSTEAQVQMLSVSQADTSTPSMSIGRIDKNSSLISSKKAVEKMKDSRQKLLVSPTLATQVATNFTLQSPPHLTQLSSPTATTAVIETTKSDKKVPKQSLPVRGDTHLHHCKSCGEPKPDFVTRLWRAATSANSVTAKLGTGSQDGEPQEKTGSLLLWNNTNLKNPTDAATGQHVPAESSLTQNNAFHNITGDHLLCKSLKHLDQCKYKIPPLGRKYDLQNMETKMAYHCDCTSRLADQLKSFTLPSVLPSLLLEFVSQHCFKLPKEKKCHSGISCFTKASDLLQAHKRLEKKDAARVQISVKERKGVFPVRLYKRCLRLQREADTVAPLT